MKCKWRRFEVQLPLRFNDGSDVPQRWFGKAANEIVAEFGGLHFDCQLVVGRWRHQGIEYRGHLVKIIVDVHDTR